MTMTDPIADMLTRIRNANRVDKKTVRVPASKLRAGIADALKRVGFIGGFTVIPGHVQGEIEITLKYGPDGERVINEIKRVSKPSCRVYRGVKDIKKVLNGFGAEIYSTTAGVLTDRECREKKVGGEVLVWVQ
jgi:small subunit ribosomal protein S8